MSEEFDEEYEERRRRRNARNEQMRKRKRQQQMIRLLIRRLLPVVAGIVVLVLFLVNGRSIVRRIQGYEMPKESDTSATASPEADLDMTQTSENEEDTEMPNSDETIDIQDADGTQNADDTEGADGTQSIDNTQDADGTQITDDMPNTDSSTDEKIDSTTGSWAETLTSLRQLTTTDRRQQLMVLGIQVSLPDMDLLHGYSGEEQEEEEKEPKVYSAQTTDTTTSVDDEVQSTNGIFIDLETGNILFDRDAHTRINPASMTKVLTMLVAAENVEDWSDTFEITPEITNFSYVHDCSAVGFSNNEVVTVEDLFYGTILCSGGDAALGLATYVAGSQEAFVDMMNEKLKELGLSETAHFTNCVGLYDENHYCTTYDIAMILEAALDNPQCREVLSAKKYTTSSTPEHPEGISISNWFLRRIEDKDTGGEVICGKTGFVAQSGSCAVSYGMDSSGHEYVCATVNAHSSWRCIYDHVELYKRFAKEDGSGADAEAHEEKE